MSGESVTFWLCAALMVSSFVAGCCVCKISVLIGWLKQPQAVQVNIDALAFARHFVHLNDMAASRNQEFKR